MTGPRHSKALALAARAHEGQVRKGTSIPDITHPVAVAALVAQYGGDEDQQIAALLHDVLEDGGAHFAAEIERDFGPPCSCSHGGRNCVPLMGGGQRCLGWAMEEAFTTAKHGQENAGSKPSPDATKPLRHPARGDTGK